MTAYVDSSALVPIYVPERFSEAARRVFKRLPQVPFTALHELEVRNAFALLRGRQIISQAEHDAIRGHLQEDIDARRLMPLPLSWSDVFVSAGELSDAHAAKHLTRSLDLLHVAAAKSAHCRTFISADDRQLALARAAKLAVVDIKRAARTSIR